MPKEHPHLAQALPIPELALELLLEQEGSCSPCLVGSEAWLSLITPDKGILELVVQCSFPGSLCAPTLSLLCAKGPVLSSGTSRAKGHLARHRDKI